MNDLSAQIEAYLLQRGDWVPCADLCRDFGVKERRFRQVKGEPGLCTDFAIARDKQFKHIKLATTTEWLRFKFKILGHAVGEIRRVRKLGRRRSHATKHFRSQQWEKDTGQAVMSLNI